MTRSIISFQQSMLSPWLMSAHRVRALLTDVRRILAGPMDTTDTPAVDPGYEVLPGGVARISIQGVIVKYESWINRYIGAVATNTIMQALNGAIADPSVRHIAIWIDSPGGMVNGSFELAAAIKQAGKPTYAICSDRALSAGYLIAASCGQISCNEAGQTGCIGVYSVLTDDSKFWADMGIADTLVSTGGVKGLGADGKVTAELIADVQREVNNTGDLFVNAVAAGRFMTTDKARALADGRCWIASEAKPKRLIDVIGEAPFILSNLSQMASTRSYTAKKGSTMSTSTNPVAPIGRCDRETATGWLKSCWQQMTSAQRNRWTSEETFVYGCRDDVEAGNSAALLPVNIFPPA